MKSSGDCGIPDNPCFVRAHPIALVPHHLLIPFAAASAPGCQALLPDLRLPNLQALLARLAEQSADRGDEHSMSPPHERALSRALGLPATDGRIPWAAAQSEAQGAGEGEEREGGSSHEGQLRMFRNPAHRQAGVNGARGRRQRAT